MDVAARRIAWRDEAANIDPTRFVFLDESGVEPRGSPGFDTRLTQRNPSDLRGIGALALDGICAAMTVAGATSSAVFLAFITQVLIPVLKRTRPDAVVVMDNLAAHKAAVVRRALDQAGVAYRYLPAYSPDMNPIEQAWSKLKACLRGKAARSREALERAIPYALATIKPSNAQGWFRHAGYPPN